MSGMMGTVEVFDSLEAWVGWVVAQADSYPEEIAATCLPRGTLITVVLDNGKPIVAGVEGEWEGEALRDLAGLLFNRLAAEIAMKRMRRPRSELSKIAGRGAC